MKQLPVSESEFHAYLDGELPESRRAAVDAYLAAQPGEAERLEAYRAQDAALRQHFAALADEAVPTRLRQLAERPSASGAGEFASAAVDRQKRPFLARWSLQRLAAGLVIALLGGAAGWFGHDRYPGGERLAQMTPLPRQAAIAHVVYSPDVRRPVEITADQEDQLVKWLSKRLGMAISPPKLGALGYELIGGRLLPGNSGPVAQFMYHDASGQRLTLYVSTENTASHDAGFRFAREGPVNVFYWVDGKFGYALSAGMDRGELARVATAVYDQLEHK
jgi:anti-sigma factor RsiW